jgi:threonine/homoserine/homoserine lactone efflux protein
MRPVSIERSLPFAVSSTPDAKEPAMPDLPHLLAFIAAGWLLNLTPGPDVLYIVANSLRSGVRAGTVAGLGITAGCFVHIFAAAVGVGTLMATSAAAFTVLKYVGAAYLLYLGVRMVLSGAAPPADLGKATAAVSGERGLKAVFLGGFWTNVLNPKVALFFLAFVPQFIDADAANKPLAFLVLGCIFNFNGMLWCNGLAIFTAFASAKLKVKPLVALWLNRVTGGLFIALGARLALAEQH